MNKISDWHSDIGYTPKLKIPDSVKGNKNPNCSEEDFIKWAKDQKFYNYWLGIKDGNVELCATFIFGLPRLIKLGLEHGKYYTWKSVGCDKPGKFQFIVQRTPFNYHYY